MSDQHGDGPQHRTNARDDLYNGASAPVLRLGTAHAECASALAQFTRDLPDFCRRLDLAPALLNLGTPELLMIVCMRQQSIIDDLAAQVSRLTFPPQQDDTP